MSHKVAIVMGSGSDRPVMEKAGAMLDRFGIEHETRVLSAHKTPDQALEFAENAADNGFEVIIAGAGKAAHLGGVMAAKSLLPVIGVPINASLDGMDALLATVQMPTGNTGSNGGDRRSQQCRSTRRGDARHQRRRPPSEIGGLSQGIGRKDPRRLTPNRSGHLGAHTDRRSGGEPESDLATRTGFGPDLAVQSVDEATGNSETET